MTKTDLREALAALEHDRWSRWEEYRASVADTQGSPEGTWRRKRDQAYSELTEQEKESDRAEADKALEIVWPLIEKTLEGCPRCPQPGRCFDAAKILTPLTTGG